MAKAFEVVHCDGSFDPELESILRKLLKLPQSERIAVANELNASIPGAESTTHFAAKNEFEEELRPRIESPASFRDSTLESVLDTFGLTLTDGTDLFAGVESREPSEWLRSMLEGSVPLARAMNTEKACSELIVAPVLTEIRLRNPKRCSLHSGRKLKVDAKIGLTVPCDFLLSRSSLQMLLAPPIRLAIRTQHGDINAGFSACIAGMVGAVRNAGGSLDRPHRVCGAVTDGSRWKFLKMEDSVVAIDGRTYWIEEVEKILGVIEAILQD